MSAADLAGQQGAFHDATVEGVPLPPALLRDLPGLDAAAGAAVYAGMYLARLEDALRADFPALAALVGHEAFHALARAYAAARPSDDPDLGRFGRHLPAFLREFPGPRPDLADLAELEWTRSEVLVAADGEPAGREALAAPGPQGFAAARLRFVPALRLVRLGHDAAASWRAWEKGEPPPGPAAGEVHLAVWRSGFDVVHGALEPREAGALDVARSGAPLGEVLAAFEGDAEAGLAALLSWVDEGWIAAVEEA